MEKHIPKPPQNAANAKSVSAVIDVAHSVNQAPVKHAHRLRLAPCQADRLVQGLPERMHAN
jgi:hypothetical protein